MRVDIEEIYTDKRIEVELLERINSGSNSVVYDAKIDYINCIVAKCSKNPENYVSFNLQYLSFVKCSEIFESTRIVVPKVYSFGRNPEIGDLLIMDRIDNLYEINFMINQSLYYGEIIIKEIAFAISELHKNKISGYDVEFFWKADTNQLVLLDIGPQNTINCSCYDMIQNHIGSEKGNLMGKWNVISQIVPENLAKTYFKNNEIEKVSIDDLMEYIDPSSVGIHVDNVAKIHALTIFGKLNRPNRKRYIDIFLNEYKRNMGQFSFDSIKYLKSLETTLDKNEGYAEAKLYYSNEKVLCTESCSVQIS